MGRWSGSSVILWKNKTPELVPKEGFTFGSGAANAAVVSGDSGNVGAADGDGQFGFRVVGATPESAKVLAFGRRKVGVVKRPSALERAGGAGAFGAPAAVEEELAITFSLPGRFTNTAVFMNTN